MLQGSPGSQSEAGELVGARPPREAQPRSESPTMDTSIDHGVHPLTRDRSSPRAFSSRWSSFTSNRAGPS